MARKPRIHYSGATYHTMLRGNNGQKIFFEENDFLIFEELIFDTVKRFNYQVLAFCWMTNHVHLLIQINEISLSKIMQNIGFRYTRYINNKHRTIGHLFQGRFNAKIVDIDNYFLQLIQYIHLNPIKAGLETKLGEYRWSSHLCYISQRNLEWLNKDVGLSKFNDCPLVAQNLYIKFLTHNIHNQSHDLSLFYNEKDSRIIGDDDFLQKINYYL